MSTPTSARPARARLGRWPFDDDIAHLVLLDHHMEPTLDDVTGWVNDAADRGATRIRTGAMFPNATPAFLECGFVVIDSLTLLTATLDTARPPGSSRASAPLHPRGAFRLRRLRPPMLAEAATIDRRSFGHPWANDRDALAEITTATPTHRSRSIHVDGHMMAFAISGRADATGYVQRLAVDPSARRHGFARMLVDDALRWMRRRHVTRALVNTASDNHGALALYRTMGFVEQPGELLIMERPLR